MLDMATSSAKATGHGRKGVRIGRNRGARPAGGLPPGPARRPGCLLLAGPTAAGNRQVAPLADFSREGTVTSPGPDRHDAGPFLILEHYGRPLNTSAIAGRTEIRTRFGENLGKRR